MTDPSNRRPTERECIEAAGAVLAASDEAIEQMTPREQAEAAWTPTCRRSVDELEDLIRVQRGLAPRDQQEGGPSLNHSRRGM
ncbi:hypothetical protein JOE61_002530 [Nocardioides salarius]|uniref:Uncharacterized protein n=1 Tax=Nocardioides salarius TaxID=374513 RepID=A0ABS2MC08_9ACTN|nr:hypothetical protein [Nocardioides salarius]MBM7508716.1 hypothetical protein [Nocardioides salarius]